MKYHLFIVFTADGVCHNIVASSMESASSIAHHQWKDVTGIIKCYKVELVETSI